MPNRRQFIFGGFAALGYGLLTRAGANPLGARPLPPGVPRIPHDPILKLPRELESEWVDGMPFQRWFSGDDWQNTEIPFHHISSTQLPSAEGEIDVAIVGGGISGLASAYLLREHLPLVFELRSRFGGNAQGEAWHDTPFSLGGAYVITPDEGSFLESFYTSLGLHEAYRESFPPDPMELMGSIRDDFWSGANLPPDQQEAFRRYADVVTYMADEGYPEIPLPDDPEAADWVRELDTRNFREDAEERMGRPMPPSLAAGVQSYFYSSFGAGMDEISAAAGWNFVAAEEYGRWVFPGGNSYMARTLWGKLREVESSLTSGPRSPLLRAGCRVIDVRTVGARVHVTWVEPGGALRTIAAKHVVMAGSKHIAKHVIHDLENQDSDKWNAINSIETSAYLVANVLLEAPIQRDFYDLFLLGDEGFPMTPGAMEAERPVIDMLRGDYHTVSQRSVLTLYWPLPWPTSRSTLLLGDPWRDYAQRLAPQVRAMLKLIDIAPSSIRQVRMTRWGHALPISRPGFLASGSAAAARRPLGDRVHFVNQDNWALPAVENSLLDAAETAAVIAAHLKQ